MSQKLLLNTKMFNDLLYTNEMKEQLSIIPSKNRYYRPIWTFRYGRDMLSNENNIKSLKRLEKNLTKSIIAWILTSNKIRTCNVRDTKRTIRIVGNKLYIKKDIEQGELDYEFEDEIRNNSTNT